MCVGSSQSECMHTHKHSKLHICFNCNTYSPYEQLTIRLGSLAIFVYNRVYSTVRRCCLLAVVSVCLSLSPAVRSTTANEVFQSSIIPSLTLRNPTIGEGCNGRAQAVFRGHRLYSEGTGCIERAQAVLRGHWLY